MENEFLKYLNQVLMKKIPCYLLEILHQNGLATFGDTDMNV